MKVRIGAYATRDLVEIGGWIAADDPAVAARFLDGLRAKALQIGEMPAGFPIVGRYRGLDVRKRSYQRYMIFFYVAGNAVTVTRVLHASRDYSRMFQ